MDEGERWAERVGRRYGIFGYHKSGNPSVGSAPTVSILAGDGANALVAYCLTKVCLFSSSVLPWCLLTTLGQIGFASCEDWAFDVPQSVLFTTYFGSDW